MAVQFLEIGGQTMAVLPVGDYEQLLNISEDKSDILAALDSEKRRANGEEYFPAEMVDRLLAGENALKVWRQYRMLTLRQLGLIVGAASSYLSEIENGKRQGRPALWRKLAEALGVDMEDIVPETAGK